MLGLVLMIPLVLILIFFSKAIGGLFAILLTYVIDNFKVMLFVVVVCIAIYAVIKSSKTKRPFIEHNQRRW